MKIERKNNEILIRIDANMKVSNLQNILDYFRYIELTSKSRGTQKDVNALVKQAKKGRWARTKKIVGLDA